MFLSSIQNLTGCKLLGQNLMRCRCFFCFKILSDVLFSAQKLTWKKNFFQFIILTKAGKKQKVTCSWSKRRKRDFLYANFYEIRHAKKFQIQNLKHFVLTQNLSFKKDTFQNLMRCNFPIRNLTCSKSFNSKSNALSFLYWKSYVLKFPAIPNLTRCTILNTKTDACFLQNPMSCILFCSNTDML